MGSERERRCAFPGTCEFLRERGGIAGRFESGWECVHGDGPC